jgi:hypothetical protein
VLKAVKEKIRMVDWMTTELVSNQKFESLQKLINLLSNNKELKRLKHNSSYSFRQFLESVYSVQRDILRKNIRGKYSILLDETTCVEHLSQIAVWIKYRDLKGCVQLSFLSLVQAGPDGCTGAALKIKLLDVLKDWGLSIYNMVGIATDGASAMRGDYHGLVALLQEDLPWLVAVHCAAHRLHLVAVDLLKSPEFLGVLQAEETCKSIAAFFHYDLRGGRLADAQANAKLSVKVMPSPNNTRWLTTKEVIDAIYDNYAILPDVLTAIANESVKERERPRGLAAELVDPTFVQNLCTLKVVLDLLQPLQIALQEDDLSPFSVQPMISSVRGRLEQAVDSGRVVDLMTPLLESQRKHMTESRGKKALDYAKVFFFYSFFRLFYSNFLLFFFFF